MMNVNQIDIEKLKKVASQSEKAKTLFQLFAERDRARKFMSFSRLKRTLHLKGVEMSLEDIRTVMSGLESVGVGASTKRGFTWYWNLMSVAQLALGSQDVSVESIKAQPEPKAPALPKVPPASPVDKRTKAYKSSTKLVKTPSSIVTIRKNGFEIDMPLDQMTPETCRRVTAILSSIEKH